MTARKPPLAPVRAALRVESHLLRRVVDGISALKSVDRERIASDIRTAFADSLDIDAALRDDNPEANRWDYLLGHSESGRIVALETHLARDDQISTIIAKRDAARRQLSSHLRQGVQVADWLWVSSGNVEFAHIEKTRLRLNQHGIRFVGKKVLAKHLPKRR